MVQDHHFEIFKNILDWFHISLALPSTYLNVCSRLSRIWRSFLKTLRLIFNRVETSGTVFTRWSWISTFVGPIDADTFLICSTTFRNASSWRAGAASWIVTAVTKITIRSLMMVENGVIEESLDDKHWSCRGMRLYSEDS